jgi:hypothetical protein
LSADIKRKKTLPKVGKKMKKNGLFAVGIVLVCGLGLMALIGCASGPRVIAYNNSVPIEEQCQLDVWYCDTIKSFDGMPVIWTNEWSNKLYNIPAGKHTFVFDYYWTNTEYTLSAKDMSISYDFLPGRIYELVTNTSDSTAKSFIQLCGYTEWIQPSANETLIVLQRAKESWIYGNPMGITIDDKKNVAGYDFSLPSGATVRILLPNGQHKMVVTFNNDSDPTAIDANGGTIKYKVKSSAGLKPEITLDTTSK